MTIEKNRIGDELTVCVSGRLDTTTAPELDTSLKDEFKDLKKLVFDFAGLEYLSSAGLRVILSCQKTMNAQGSMVVRNSNSSIREIFDITGFCDIITLE